MIFRNLRHLRAFLAAAENGSMTRAAAQHRVSQPAVTQAIAGLETLAGGALFDRRPQGLLLTERGGLLERRARRALMLIDRALADVSPRAARITSAPQLQALIAVVHAENVSLAARRLGLAQPTVHRAVTHLDREAEGRLFQRSRRGLVATPVCRAVARAAELAFDELRQAEADLADFDGREGGRIVIGALPLARSVLLPRALAGFRRLRPTLPVTVVDGRYDDLLDGLRRGAIDLMIGALREPAPVGDVIQEALFDDRLTVLARPGHPLVGRRGLTARDLAAFPWAMPAAGTPTRRQIDAFLADGGPPPGIVETGSLLLMRGLLAQGDFLGCISHVQAGVELAHGLLVPLDVAVDWPRRPIGLTTRDGWLPTRAQIQLVDLLRRPPADGDRTIPALIPDGFP